MMLGQCFHDLKINCYNTNKMKIMQCYHCNINHALYVFYFFIEVHLLPLQ